MKTSHSRRFTRVAAVIAVGLFTALQVPGSVRAGTTTDDRVLTGELVVINAARNHFRLVEHRGSFTAPAGTALEALDGKPVRVELGRNGRVLQVSQMPVHIEPIAHGFEVISGQLVLRDPVARTFSIAGDDRTFVAPPRTSMGRYAGHLVEVRLDEQGQVMTINPITADAPLSQAPHR